MALWSASAVFGGPAISGVSVPSVGAFTATITWATDIPATSQVDYGLSPSYGQSTTLDTSLVGTHVQVLTGLVAGARYHYRVNSRDSSQNLATSGDFTFITAPSGSGAGTPFTLVALPDTQYYSAGYPSTFTSQTQWILNNRLSKNIVYVLHEGDLVDSDSSVQWSNANNSLSLLDGIVPYALVPGNHDQCLVSCPPDKWANYNQTFPVSRYAGWPTFGGVFESGRLNNSYHLFSAGGVDWVILSLEFGPRDSVLTWAGNIVDSFPGRRVIILTHTYLYLDDTLQGSSPLHQFLPPNNNGVAIWNRLVRNYRNIMFVLSGHVVPAQVNGQAVGGNNGAGRLVSTGDFGNSVYQLMADYQEQGNGGYGFLRVLTFDPTARTTTVTTYSPTINSSYVDAENQFQFTNVDLTPPLAPVNRPPLAVAGSDRKVRLGDAITLSGAGSVDPDGDALTFTWDFGDGTGLQTGMNLSHVYQAAGSYTATLTIRDATYISTSSVAITVLGGNTLFVEDFNDGTRARWTTADEGTAGPSRWKVSLTGFLEQVGYDWGGDLFNGTNKPGTYVSAGDPTWTNYAFSSRVSTADGNTLGVMFRYVDTNNYYLFAMDRRNGYYRRLVRRSGGINTVLATDSGSYNVNQWYTVGVQANGGNIAISLNGTTLFSVNDPNPLLAGKIALYSWADQATYFDDILVTALGSVSNISVSVVPSSASLNASLTQQFSATLTGTTNTAVTWASNPGGVGGVSSSGLYTAPALIPSQQNVTVTATSVADSTRLASAIVTLNPIAVSVSPGAASLTASQAQQFTAAITGTFNSTVTWSITPASVGSVSPVGLYLAPVSIGSQQTVTVTATSSADPSKSASAIVTLNPSQVATPAFAPPAGNYSATQSVTISTSTAGASIRYTTDGSTPSSTVGIVYSVPVSVSSSGTLKAIAYKAGMTDSLVSTGSYIIQVAAPAFNPPAGTYGTAQSVTISTSTAGASIRYTTDGSTPSSTVGIVYSVPVSVSSSRTLKAIAYKAGMTDSLVSTAVYTITGGGGAPWFNSSWTNRKSITIDHTKVSGLSNLSNFPMLFSVTDANLKTVSNGGRVGKADGTDILFAASDGVTKLDHELGLYTASTGATVVWVRIPTLSPTADTTIYMYYGNASAANQQNSAGVWGNYAGVWHLSQNPGGTSPQLLDSTSNGQSLTTFGSMASNQQVSGKIDSSISFNSGQFAGSSGNLQLSGNATTLSAWVNVPNTSGAHSIAGVSQNSWPYNNNYFNIENGLIGYHIYQMNVAYADLTGSTAITANSWHYIVCTYDGSAMRTYLDGAADATAPTSIAVTGDAPFRIASAASGSGKPIGSLAGMMDEVRASSTVARSADWILTEYRNQNSPASFYAVGPQQ